MDHVALLQGGSYGPVQTVFEEKLAFPLDDVREQVTEVGRILIQQVVKVELSLGGYEVIEPNLRRRNLRPRTLS